MKDSNLIFENFNKKLGVANLKIEKQLIQHGSKKNENNMKFSPWRERSKKNGNFRFFVNFFLD